MTELFERSQAIPNVEAEISLEDLIHVGPGTLCGEYLRTFWHPVLPARLLAPGHTKPMRVLGEDFTLYRGATGEVHAVAARCAHRGTLLSTGWVEDDCVRCFYHGWKFDGTGQCVEQPDEHPCFAKNIKIRSYPIREYIDTIFVFFGEGEPPELARYRNFEAEDTVNEDGSRNSLITTTTYSWPCSYFNSLENDSFHGNWVHRDTYRAIGRLSGNGEQELEVEETEYGLVTHITRKNARRFAVTDRFRIMPNGNYRRASDGGGEDGTWTEAMNWRVPIDDERFLSCNVNRVHGSEEALQNYEEQRKRKREMTKDLMPASEIAEAIIAGEMRFQDFPGRMEGVSDPRLFAIGDYVTQVGQGTFGLMNDEHLGRTDIEVRHLRRLYRRELKAFAEGRPLKQWIVPDWFNVRISED